MFASITTKTAEIYQVDPADLVAEVRGAKSRQTDKRGRLDVAGCVS